MTPVFYPMFLRISVWTSDCTDTRLGECHSLLSLATSKPSNFMSWTKEKEESFLWIMPKQKDIESLQFHICIGVVAIGTLGTQALPNKERNLSIRNQKVFKYWAQYKEISSKFKWIVLNLGHQQLILLSSQYCTWNISNRNQEREKVPSLENASTTPMVKIKLLLFFKEPNSKCPRFDWRCLLDWPWKNITFVNLVYWKSINGEV